MGNVIIAESVISHHALLRYLERYCRLDIKSLRLKAERMGYLLATDAHTVAFIRLHGGIDVDAVRARLESPKLLAAIAAGAKSVRHNGVQFVINDGVVVTTILKAPPRRVPKGNYGRLKRMRLRPLLVSDETI